MQKIIVGIVISMLCIGIMYASMHNTKKSILHKPTSSLWFLYDTFFGKKIRSVLTKKWFSSLAGRYADTHFSRRHVKNFVKKHKINMDEAERPMYAYRSFNDFFTRTLKPEARIIDAQHDSIISPADGMITAYDLSTKKQFCVKNKQFNLGHFIQDKHMEQEFTDGILLVVRLAPWDYHRFHFPINCVPSQPKIICGKYESVHPIVYQAGIQPLTENERQLIHLKGDYNDILMISVGALCVGKIHHTFTLHKSHTKGSEAGYFCFGGSTVVLVFKPQEIVVEDFILHNSLQSKETPIKMGQVVARQVFN